MCGIAGLVDLHGADVAAGPAAAMARALAHRGPDGDGFWSDGPATLGHRRLAILDLSPAGAQPMSVENGAVQIVYNGEIYNYIELRDELRALGHCFTTATDTEVILRAYLQWDTGCLHRFNGMFALAMWDVRRRRLLCARDRFGIKPFYYTVQRGTLAFASEAKALLAAGLVRAAPDDAVVHRFLASGYHPSGEKTFFAGVRSLPAAHMLVVENGRVATRRWWRLPPHEGYADLSDGEAAERFRALFEDAVRLRLRSDVPVGTCLSGGLDSSSIVCTLAGAVHAGEQHTFSAIFDDPGISEEQYVRAVVEHTGVVSHMVRPSWDELIADLPRIVWHQEAPFLSTSIFAQWKVMELARRAGVTVLLDGQGADEVLAGYPPYWDDHLAALARAGRVSDLLTEARLVARARGEPLARVLGRAALRQRPAPRRPSRLIHPDFAASFPPFVPEPAGYPDRLTGRLAFDLTAANLPGLLHYEDRNSMAFSIEARLPFLDYRLVEFAFSLPPEQKLRRGLTKRVLRNAMHGVLPEVVRNRRDKLGFVTPETAWLGGPGRGWAREILHSPEFRARPYFDPAACAALPLEPETSELRDFQLWRCLSLELWLRTFVDGAHPFADDDGHGAVAGAVAAGRC